MPRFIRGFFMPFGGKNPSRSRGFSHCMAYYSHILLQSLSNLFFGVNAQRFGGKKYKCKRRFSNRRFFKNKEKPVTIFFTDGGFAFSRKQKAAAERLPLLLLL